MPLFEVAIIQMPTKKEIEEGGQEKLLMKPTPVIASDIQGAGIAAVLDGELPKDIDRTRMKVIVRPFE